jgi:hypothetical protein
MFHAMLFQGAEKFGVDVAEEKRRLLVDCFRDYLAKHPHHGLRTRSKSFCTIRSRQRRSRSFTITTTVNFASSTSCTCVGIDGLSRLQTSIGELKMIYFDCPDIAFSHE